LRGPVAQLVEQGTFNPKVAGSIPARPIFPRAPLRGRGAASPCRVAFAFLLGCERAVRARIGLRPWELSFGELVVSATAFRRGAGGP
jgi:hypothetical protein